MLPLFVVEAEIRYPIVDEQLAIYPEAHAVIREDRESIGLAVLRLHGSAPTRGEIGLADGVVGTSAVPVEVHHAISPHQSRRHAE